MSRISFFKKRVDNLYLGGFRGDKSRGTKIFSIGAFLTLTLVKIGGQRLILEYYGTIRTSSGTTTYSTDFELVSYAVICHSRNPLGIDYQPVF